MNVAAVRKLARRHHVTLCPSGMEGDDGTEAVLNALADVYEAAQEEHRDFGLRPPCVEALARVEAL